VASIYSWLVTSQVRKQGKSWLLWASSDPNRILHPFWGCYRCTRPLLLGSVRAGTLTYPAMQLFSKYSNIPTCVKITDEQTTCNLIAALCVASRGNKQYISANTLYFLETTPTGLHFAADNISLSSLKFFWCAAEFLFTSASWRFGSSRSSKVDKFGANRKRGIDFLLVPNSNFGPILHHSWARTRFMCSWPHPYSTLILGVFSLHQIAHVGVSQSRGLKLFGREIIFQEFKPIWTRYLIVTDRQTDRQTDDMQSHNRAVKSIVDSWWITKVILLHIAIWYIQYNKTFKSLNICIVHSATMEMICFDVKLWSQLNVYENHL